MTDELIPLPDAARRLGLAPATLARQARLGRIVASKVGARWAVTAEEIERYRRVSRGQPGRRSRGQDEAFARRG